MVIPVFKFYRDSCVPCKALQRVLDKTTLPEGVIIVSLNVENEQDLAFAKHCGVSGVPTLMFENGKSLSGAMTEESIIEFLSQGGK